MPTFSTPHYIGTVIAALIILGGLYAIARNFAVFFIDILRGSGGKQWFNRPYLFRALAWAFTLFWLYGPYTDLHLTQTNERILAFGFFIFASAAWLWVLRVSFLDGIPQQELSSGPAWAKGIGWNGHATLTYLIQLVCATILGLIFVSFGKDSPLYWLLVIPFLIGTAGMSIWRISTLTAPGETLGEHLQHALAGRDAQHPQHNDPSLPSQ